MLNEILLVWCLVGLLLLVWSQMRLVEHGARIVWWAMPVLVILWPVQFLLVWLISALSQLDDSQ